MFEDKHFENAYVAQLTRDADFLAYVKDDLSSDLFENPARTVVSIVLDYERDYSAPPCELVYAELKSRSKWINEDSYKQIEEYLNSLFKLELRNRQRLLKEHDSFVRKQALKKILPKVIDAGKEGNLDRVEELFKEWVTFKPKGELNPGSTLTIDPDERIQRRHNEDFDTDYFSFLIPELDRAGIFFKRRQLFTIQSQASSMGKTAFFAHCVRALVAQGKRVLVYLTEETEEEFEDRLDQCIVGCTSEELTDYMKLRMAMQRWLKGEDGRKWLRYKSWDEPVRADELKDHARLLENYYGFVPDVILIDYGDEVLPTEAKWVDNSYEAGKNVWSYFVRWAKRENIAIGTAAQSQRSAEDAARADKGHIAGSKAKIDLSHLAISINRNKAQEEEGMTELFVMKNRTGPARFSVMHATDMERGQFYVRNWEG